MWDTGAQQSAGLKMFAVVAFYDITWDNGRFKKEKKHEKTLTDDLQRAIEDFNADLILLSGCGEIEEGLYKKLWLAMLRRICGPGFVICHQSHYTSIVRFATMEVTKEPTLLGPLTSMIHHDYRKCQCR